MINLWCDKCGKPHVQCECPPAEKPPLLNCPFCGQPPLERGFLAGHDEGCLFDLMARRGISQAELDAAWNTRLLERPTVACSNACDLDFVFLDSEGKAFRVRKTGGHYWIHYKHTDNRWVTLSRIKTQSELWKLETACIDWKYHEVYEFGIPFKREGWPA